MKDILGSAMLDYYENPAQRWKLWVHYPDGTKDEMPLATYFRDWHEMPLLEQIALQECRGRVLDIGAGAGSHALFLQEKELEVTSLDISPGAVAVMQLRGVKHPVCQDIFKLTGQRYDTLLLLMNGIGLAGSISGLKDFLAHAATLLQDNGQLLFDSSDVAYLYEDGTPRPQHYYGEIRCRYAYKQAQTDWFQWLYVDQQTLAAIAKEMGWKVRLLFEDEEAQYLVQLTKM